jgi:hypothetical protein
VAKVIYPEKAKTTYFGMDGIVDSGEAKANERGLHRPVSWGIVEYIYDKILVIIIDLKFLRGCICAP